MNDGTHTTCVLDFSILLVCIVKPLKTSFILKHLNFHLELMLPHLFVAMLVNTGGGTFKWRGIIQAHTIVSLVESMCACDINKGNDNKKYPL